MKSNFFAIGHGIDNYEAWVDLNEVIAIKISSALAEKLPKEKWTHHVIFIMSTGTELEEDLNDWGMEELANLYKIKGWNKSGTPGP